MRDQLVRYVDLLFAGAKDADDIKQEILQNTLDRYDDLVSQGKSPEAAYSLAISGIGDVSEILGNAKPAAEPEPPRLEPEKRSTPEARNVPAWKKVLRAVAVCLYIISIIPLIVLSEFEMEIIGLCGMLAIVGVATALIIIAAGNKQERYETAGETVDEAEPGKELKKAIGTITGLVALIVYLVISFATGAWHITWLIFLIAGAVDGVIGACMDVRRATGSAVARIVIYSVVVLLLLAILLVFLGYDLLVFKAEQWETEQVEKITNQETVEAATVRELEIDWSAGSITIITADTDEITVTETGSFTERYHMVCTVTEGILRIEYAQSPAFIGIGATPVKDLTVTVPQDWTCDSLELDAAAVEVLVRGLHAASVELDGAAMEFTFDGNFGALSCDGAACEVKAVVYEVPATIDIDGAACVIDLTLPEDCGFRVQMEGLACAFNSDRAFTGGAGIWTSGNEDCRIYADGIACEVTIR